ncbi:active regulator of SIRT1-like, partial [Anoplophora glabripennis]|uniref:active regulator of SIRT1-like n=1 Tax=Anoplophora glabripennis TaxID=217634 RepID=UPI00087393F9
SVEKVNILSHKNKINIVEAKRNFKTRDQILKENLEKLKLIKEASKVTLDKETINQIIERAVTKRPVKKVKKQKKDNSKTAFTEEDFKKFEEEYFDD